MNGIGGVIFETGSELNLGEDPGGGFRVNLRCGFGPDPGAAEPQNAYPRSRKPWTSQKFRIQYRVSLKSFVRANFCLGDFWGGIGLGFGGGPGGQFGAQFRLRSGQDFGPFGGRFGRFFSPRDRFSGKFPEAARRKTGADEI